MTPQELKEIDERIAVMKAWKEGKPIQYRMHIAEDDNPGWLDMKYGGFDFVHNDYRIKPEPRYRPFKSAEEVYEAVKKHGLLLKSRVFIDEYYTILTIGSSFINAGSSHDYSFEESMANTMFADGAPFGKKED